MFSILKVQLQVERLPFPHNPPTFQITKLSLFEEMPWHGAFLSHPAGASLVSLIRLLFLLFRVGLKAAGPGIGQGDHLSCPG